MRGASRVREATKQIRGWKSRKHVTRQSVTRTPAALHPGSGTWWAGELGEPLAAVADCQSWACEGRCAPRPGPARCQACPGAALVKSPDQHGIANNRYLLHPAAPRETPVRGA